MYIIKPCPSCGAKNRFPIHSGTLKVRCRCGHAFIANPDDTSLYADAAFDLKGNKPDKKTLSVEVIKKQVIGALYSLWYSLCNFKLLPTRTQIAVSAVIAVLMLLLVLVFYAVFSSAGARPPQGGIVP